MRPSPGRGLRDRRCAAVRSAHRKPTGDQTDLSASVGSSHETRDWEAQGRKHRQGGLCPRRKRGTRTPSGRWLQRPLCADAGDGRARRRSGLGTRSAPSYSGSATSQEDQKSPHNQITSKIRIWRRFGAARVSRKGSTRGCNEGRPGWSSARARRGNSAFPASLPSRARRQDGKAGAASLPAVPPPPLRARRPPSSSAPP